MFDVSFALGFCVLAGFLAACGNKASAPPPPMAVEAAPDSLQQVAEASKANPETQAMLTEAIAALRGKNYPHALFLLQNLSGRSDLLPEQRSVVSGSLLTVNKALAEQASAGNAQAQQAINFYRANK